jgi:hypothetical protein
MENRIVWSIVELRRLSDNGGVVEAHWSVSATQVQPPSGEEGFEKILQASAYGAVGFTPDPTAEGFVPYEQLTEADVLAWVWASVDKDETEASLAAQIDAQKNPVSASGVPWQNVAALETNA